MGTLIPDNPFVLGYVITNLKEVAVRGVPPIDFIPRQSDLTTTGNKSSLSSRGRSNPLITNGTLNCCLLTHCSDPDDTQCETNPVVMTTSNAGFLSESLFKTTKATSGDGILAFTEDLVVQKFLIQMIRPELWVDPKDLLGNPSEGFSRLNTKDMEPITTGWLQEAKLKTNLKDADNGGHMSYMEGMINHSYL